MRHVFGLMHGVVVKDGKPLVDDGFPLRDAARTILVLHLIMLVGRRRTCNRSAERLSVRRRGLNANRAKNPRLNKLVELPLDALGEPRVVDDDAGFDVSRLRGFGKVGGG